MPSAKRRAATRPDDRKPDDGTQSDLPRKFSFAPVVDAHTRLLILGSLPGERSLERGEYYAHPQNQFWRLAGGLAKVDLAAMPYPERLVALLEARIGLWDVVMSAKRSGSLDSRIEDEAANDLTDLTGRLPELRAVAFNGGTASRIGRRSLESAPNLHLLTLPSSSPAYTMSFAQKRASWTTLISWLG